MTDSIAQNAVENEPAEAKNSRKRRLTAEQLAHKRELDRRAQRNNREKTRSRIAHLEGIVEALQNRDHDRLIDQIDDQKAEIERLKGLLSSVANLVRTVDANGAPATLKTQPLIEARDTSEDARRPACHVSPIKIEDDDTPTQQVGSGSSGRGSNESRPEANDGMRESPVDTTTQQLVSQTQQQRESITQMATNIFNKTGLDGRMWFVCGVILRHILATTPPSQINYQHDEDIAIRAVFEGWSSVVEQYPLDRGWQWLKEVDERIYFHRWAPFRLMHLRNCRLIFLRQIMNGTCKSKDKLPIFFQPRPAEENIEHDPLIEYFPWPGLRERMLFRPTMFATNKFMDNLRCEIDFSWGSDPHQLYRMDPVSGRYTYSDLFHNGIEDLRCYPGTATFFESFPELKSDVPQKAGTNLTLLRLGYSDQEQAIQKARRNSTRSDWTYDG